MSHTKNLVDLDPRDLAVLDKALDALAVLHDTHKIGLEDVYRCLCQEASSWRAARDVLNFYKTKLGLKIRLLDNVSPYLTPSSEDPP